MGLSAVDFDVAVSSAAGALVAGGDVAAVIGEQKHWENRCKFDSSVIEYE
jgi:hypothetical protein